MISKEKFLENMVGFQSFISEKIEKKEIRTQVIIQNALSNSENPVLACSWGKDSFLMLYLVLKEKPDIKVVFSNTGVEFPETYKFRDMVLKDVFPGLNYTELKPERNFWEIVKENGYPAKSRYNQTQSKKKGVPACCYILKEAPADKYYRDNNVDCVFVGLTHDEGRLRRTKIIESGTYYYVKRDKRFKCLPIAYWGEEDVFQYHFKNNLPLNEGYKHSPRIGCMPCTGHIGWEKQMAKSNYKMYRHVQKQLGQELISEY
jgi:phosphoadenosine phosphosulfate reductase